MSFASEWNDLMSSKSNVDQASTYFQTTPSTGQLAILITFEIIYGLRSLAFEMKCLIDFVIGELNDFVCNGLWVSAIKPLRLIAFHIYIAKWQ